MFSTKHYIPILKWKPAEKKALEFLGAERKKYITPIIQLVMPKPKKVKNGEKEKTTEEQFNEVIEIFQDKIEKIPEEILKYWGNTPIFIDVNLLYTPALQIETLNKLLKIAVKLNMSITPVVDISCNQKIKNAICPLVRQLGNGLCLRLVGSDFDDPKRLHKDIEAFLSQNKLTENKIDLLIDIQEIYKNNDKYHHFIDLSQKITNLLNWRTYIFASGSFPINLTEFKMDAEEHRVPRFEWKNWVDLLKTKKLQRTPSFADYTIQYPIYEEASQFRLPSPSIKYTLNDDWLILRGKKGHFEHYLANAKLLSDHPNFFGEDFSAGDKFIVEKGEHLHKYLKNQNIGGTGNATTWLAAGINHHLTCTANQIANLI